MPDNKSQSLKAFKKGAAKERSRADRQHDLTRTYEDEARIYNSACHGQKKVRRFVLVKEFALVEFALMDF